MSQISSFFIAGIMQGSLAQKGIHDQGYRKQIKQAILRYFPQAKIICPLEENPDSVEYPDTTGREVFFRLLRQAAEAEVMVAFLPEASMGTALEMWEAFRHKRRIWSISPLRHNWVVKYLSEQIFPDIPAFEEHLARICRGEET